MNSLGISSYSAYISTSSASSVYKSTQASMLENKQAVSDEQNQSAASASSDEINDTALISDEAQALYNMDKSNSQPTPPEKTESQPPQTSQSSTPQTKAGLTPEQQQVLTELKVIDTKVRTHEQAHIAASGGLSASSPSYSYQVGPDGKKYAVGGEVNITFIPTGDPEKDIVGAEAMKAAALAPVDPSSQDQSVARNADQIIAELKQQIVEQKDEARKASEQADEAEKSDKTEEADKPQGANSVAALSVGTESKTAGQHGDKSP